MRGSINDLGDSREIALKRFYSMERKFSKNERMYQLYTEFMHGYEELGHMTYISAALHDYPSLHHLPHHAVMREASITTKLRVVFDGSCKTASGISLNDILHQGPTLQPKLFAIILRFRLHKYVISADIANFYRQILIQPEHQNLQVILWRERSSEPIRTYKLNTVT